MISLRFRFLIVISLLACGFEFRFSSGVLLASNYIGITFFVSDTQLLVGVCVFHQVVPGVFCSVLMPGCGSLVWGPGLIWYILVIWASLVV